MDNKIYSIENLQFKQDGFNLSVDTLTIEKNEKIAVLGENGSGKTTFLNIISGFNKNYKGKVLFQNTEMRNLSFDNRSKLLSYLPQFSEIHFGYTVFETILFGRFPHLQGNDFSEEDIKKTEKLILKFDLEKYKNKSYSHLSGGEKRRVMIARILNQESPVLLLDEPTSMIDIKYSISIYDFLSNLTSSTIIATIHDINLALKFFNRFIFMKNGKILYNLIKEEINKEVLYNVYEVEFNNFGNFFFIGK